MEIKSLGSSVSVVTKLFAERQLNVSVLLAVTETFLFSKAFRRTVNHVWHPIQYVRMFVRVFVVFRSSSLQVQG
jgi:hypothetical protein